LLIGYLRSLVVFEREQDHGVANLISGLLGGLTSYMAYSTSALYHKAGGGGLVSNLIVAGLLAATTVYGPSVVSYFPRPLAGALLAHLGRW